MWFFTGENADSPDKVFDTLKQEYTSLITSVKGMFAEVFGTTAVRKGFEQSLATSLIQGRPLFNVLGK